MKNNKNNWKDRISFYNKGGSCSTKSSEDMIARRVLRGLGASENQLPKLEAKHGIKPDYSQPTWNRVYKLLNFISNGDIGGDSDVASLVIDTSEVKVTSNNSILSDKEYLKNMYDIASRYRYGITILARVANTKTVNAYSIVDSQTLPDWVLQPVSTLISRENGKMIWVQDAEVFIRNLAECKRWEI